MKTIVAILFCGISFWLQGDDLNSIHRKNIELAIHGFGELLTNANESASHDFFAILGEIKDIKQKASQMELISKLIEPIFNTPKDMWKYERRFLIQGDRVSYLGKAMRSIETDIDIVSKWRNYIRLLQSMKAELSLYANVQHPDAYRNRWIALANEDLKRKIKELGTNKNIIISGPVPISKEEREASAKWSYKRRLIFDIDRYGKMYFDSLVLQDDYRKLPKEEQKILIEMVREGLGRYPKWYQEDSVEKK